MMVTVPYMTFCDSMVFLPKVQPKPFRSPSLTDNSTCQTAPRSPTNHDFRSSSIHRSRTSRAAHLPRRDQHELLRFTLNYRDLPCLCTRSYRRSCLRGYLNRPLKKQMTSRPTNPASPKSLMSAWQCQHSAKLQLKTQPISVKCPHHKISTSYSPGNPLLLDAVSAFALHLKNLLTEITQRPSPSHPNSARGPSRLSAVPNLGRPHLVGAIGTRNQITCFIAGIQRRVCCLRKCKSGHQKAWTEAQEPTGQNLFT